MPTNKYSVSKSRLIKNKQSIGTEHDMFIFTAGIAQVNMKRQYLMEGKEPRAELNT